MMVIALGFALLVAGTGLSGQDLADQAVVSAANWPERTAQSALDAVRDSGSLPGLSMAVARLGRPVISLTSGYADLEAGRPVSASTQFRLASVSKLYLASLVARLAAEGRFDLDERADHYLPTLPPHAAGITGRQLAAHISGMGHYTEADEFPELYLDSYGSAAEALDIFIDRPLLDAPGRAYVYSTFGYTLLQALVEAATGQAYPELLATEILLPAGLLETGPDRLGDRPTDFSELYELQAGVAETAPRRDYSYSWGGAGMRASARDVARFGLGHLDPDVTARELWDSMLEPARFADGRAVVEGNYSVGLGWRTMPDPFGRRLAFHTGVIVGGRSALLVYLDHGLSIALLANSSWVAQIDRTAALLAAPYLTEQPLDRPQDCPEQDVDLVGTFDGGATRAALHLRWENGQCLGVLHLDGAVKAWMRGFDPRFGTARLVGLSADAGTRHFLLATPVGLAELRIRQDDDSRIALTTEWGQRRLSLTEAVAG
tara:strand:- start:29 stop:1498 length:1470 start_codon:yes stop_codon:yes gene_type:complete